MPHRNDRDADQDIHDTPGPCPPGIGDDCPQAERLRQIRNDTKNILLLLRGDGTEDRPGLVIEVDRLKRTVDILQRIVYTTIAAILLAFIAALVGLVMVNHRVDKVSRGEGVIDGSIAQGGLP